MSDGAGEHGHATKHPRLAELEGMVRDGSVDTIVVAFTDMQGRLMGKRPLLHVPARHGHGDEHAGRVPAHELGDRLR